MESRNWDVDYRVADLLDLPAELVGRFDLVVDVFTVQALPRSRRADAVAGVRSLLAPGGDLLAVQFVLGPGVPEDAGPPGCCAATRWSRSPLTRSSRWH